VEGCFEKGNEPLGFIKEEKFLENLSVCWSQKKFFHIVI
jgi:hypothetical protein